MSLINDALKKAQKQRTGEVPTLSSMPSVGGEPAHRIAKRAKPAGFETLILRAGIAGVVAVALGVGAYFAFGRKPETGNLKPEGSPTSVAGVADPGLGSVSTSPAPGSATPVANTPTTTQPATAAPLFTLPTAKTEPVAPRTEPTKTASTSMPAAKPLGEPLATSPFAASSPPGPKLPAANAQPSTLNTQPASPAAVLKMESRAIQFIENLKVAGIRASATDAKVLMNDRVYRIGSTVEAELGLKLVEIAPGALTFEDDRGARYTRTF